MTPPEPRHPTAAEQFFIVRRWYPTASFHRGVITVSLIPTPASPTYVVDIDYSQAPLAPLVNVVRPSVRSGAPHLFRPEVGRDLCLFYRGEWTPALSFAESIVPWCEEWLFYYERWLEVGRWDGPEAPHGRAKKRR